MTMYQKIGGVWTPATFAYMKYNGVQTPVANAYVKQAGVWNSAYAYSVTPPPAPELDLAIVDYHSGSTLIGRTLNVSVRIPGSATNTNVKFIRVLSTYNNAAPTTQYGGTYSSTPDNGSPKEPWSEWRYNGYGTHTDTSVLATKRWPINAAYTYKLPVNTKYYFTAWSCDFAGNWSTSTAASITTPNTLDAPNVIYKNARFGPNQGGSALASGYNDGELIQQGSPESKGIYFYGTQFNDSVGQTGTPTISSAQIALQRTDDVGAPTANIYIASHNYATAADLPSNTASRVYYNSVKLGTLAKGEGKWFSLPSTFYAGLNSQTKGFVLLNKDPVKAAPFAEDYSVLRSYADGTRAGEVYLTWSETV